MLLTEEELSKKIQVSRQTILAWRKRGLPYLKPDKALRYDYEKVIEWMEENTKRDD